MRDIYLGGEFDTHIYFFIRQLSGQHCYATNYNKRKNQNNTTKTI